MAKPTFPTEYWTIWGDDQVCSKYKSFVAAEKAARGCEADGGAPHRIYLVKEVARSVRRGKVNA